MPTIMNHSTNRLTKSREPFVSPMPEMLLTFGGRISREQFWFEGILFLVPFNIFASLLISDVRSVGALVIGIIMLMSATWIQWAIMVKRWHDRDNSAWWLLMLLIPGLNFLAAPVIAFILMFWKGTNGPNRFGPDPLQRG